MRAGDVLGAPAGGLGDRVLEADIAIHPVRGRAGLLDEGRDRPDRGIGQVTHHAQDRGGLEDDVRVGDHDRLRPVVLEQSLEAVVERVRLPLAAVLPAVADHPTRVLRFLRREQLRGSVGASVVDHREPKAVDGVVELHHPVDAEPQDRSFVPGRYDDGDPGAVLQVDLVVVVVVAPAVPGEQHVLEHRDTHGHRAEQHQQAEDPQPDAADVLGDHGHADCAIRTARRSAILRCSADPSSATTSSK